MAEIFGKSHDSQPTSRLAFVIWFDDLNRGKGWQVAFLGIHLQCINATRGTTYTAIIISLMVPETLAQVWTYMLWGFPGTITVW